MRVLLVIVAGVVAAATVTLPRLAEACAGCRNPNLPITRLSTARLAAGQVRASALVSATTLNVVHQAGCADPADCHEVPVQPPFLHDQDIYPGELRAVVELGLSRSWGLEVQVPLRVTKTSIRYSDLDGGPYKPLDPDAHHRDETLAGLGDPWLLGRWGTLLEGASITARAGVTVPVGHTEEDPFALGAQGRRHQHIQFGNGTVDPLLMLDLSRTFGKVDLSVYGQAQLTVYENRKGFRAGNRFFAGAQAGVLAVEKLTVALGTDVLWERPERWGGEIQQDGNLGRTELLGGVSLTRPFGATIASLMARVPVYRDIVTSDEPQGRLSSTVMLTLMLSRTFGQGAP
jgi:hypothetical protein